MSFASAPSVNLPAYYVSVIEQLFCRGRRGDLRLYRDRPAGSGRAKPDPGIFDTAAIYAADAVEFMLLTDFADQARAPLPTRMLNQMPERHQCRRRRAMQGRIRPTANDGG